MKNKISDIIVKNINEDVTNAGEVSDLILNLFTNNNMVYEFLYCSCIHESSHATMSLHYSKEGAEKAMEDHKQKKLDEFNKLYIEISSEIYDFHLEFGEHEDWCINAIEILP